MSKKDKKKNKKKPKQRVDNSGKAQRIRIAEKYRKQLIRNCTKAEWCVRSIMKTMGIQFKFQHIIYIDKKNHFFIVDFLLKEKRILEVDGGYHNTEEQKKHDIKRTALLRKNGYEVYRIANEKCYNTMYLFEVLKIFV